MFLPLTKDEIKLIGKLLLKKVKKNLAKEGFGFEISESGLDLLAELGYDPQFGARPLKRVIQKEITNELAKQLLGGKINPGDKVMVDAKKGAFVFNGEAQAPAEKPKQSKKKDAEEDKKNGQRKEQIDELMKATEDVKKAVKDIEGSKPKTRRSKPKPKPQKKDEASS